MRTARDRTKPATPSAAEFPGADGSDRQRISDYTVRRLSMYFRMLEEVERSGRQVISSAALAKLAGTNSAQVRKDLSYFGNFGKRGRGYSVIALRDTLRGILGLNRSWRVALVGAGHLGSALFSYKDFNKHGFHIVAILDVDPGKTGQSWDGVPIQPFDQCERVMRETGAEVAVIVTPAEAAQVCVDRLARAGVRGFLNFAPCKLNAPRGTTVRNVNITIELEGLSYALQGAGEDARAGE